MGTSGISRVFQECFTGDSSLLNQFQREFQEGFKDPSSKFQGSFIEVSKIFHRSFKDLSQKFQRSFIEVLRKFQENDKMFNTSLVAKGALANSLQRLQNPKWPPGGPKMAEGVWKGVYPQVFGYSKQLSQNKFFDPSIPSMRKGRDGEMLKFLKIN